MNCDKHDAVLEKFRFYILSESETFKLMILSATKPKEYSFIGRRRKATLYQRESTREHPATHFQKRGFL